MPGLFRLGQIGRVRMGQTLFMLCMFFGIAAVALIALTLLGIAVGKIDV